MKAVLLAAGEGKRMHPLTYTRPKVMLPIANKPLLEWNILHIKEAGIRDIVIVVGYKSEMVRSYFGDGNNWDVHIEYVNQGKPQGTAHALGMVKSFVDDFIVLNGDTIIGSSDISMLRNQQQAIGVIEVPEGSDYGSVELKEGSLDRIHEKMPHPQSKLINAGIYRLTSSIFEFIGKTRLSPRGEYELTDALNMLAGQDDVVAINLKQWRDVGYPWNLLTANRDMLAGIKQKVKGHLQKGVTIEGTVIVGEGSKVMSGSYLEGPVVIGVDCLIGPNCYIRPATSIGNNCHVGNACEVKNTILMDHSNIPHQNYVGDSIIGQNCNLGAGTKIANLRLDKQPISVAIDGRVINTGRRKLGAIMGDHVQTGINSVIDVGTVLGNNVFIGPRTLASGFIAPGTRIV
jgi:bifunctional UDP-N-acetylglucosamine pyrophosphorylase/glucosamine-1-phosphate N-acetyltransferase